MLDKVIIPPKAIVNRKTKVTAKSLKNERFYYATKDGVIPLACKIVNKETLEQSLIRAEGLTKVITAKENIL